MSEAAPLTCITALIIPSLATFVMGTPFIASLYAGMAAAILAVTCLARGGETKAGAIHLPRARLAALGAGTMFGIGYIFIGHASSGDGLWPIVAMQTICTLGTVLYAVFFNRDELRDINFIRSPFALAAGIAVMLGNFCFIRALESGGFLPILVTLALLAVVLINGIAI